jgi:hypothetical protein
METCESGEVDDELVSDYLSASDMQGLRPKAILKLDEKTKEDKGTVKKKLRGYLLDKNRFIYNDIFRRTGAIVFSSSKGGEYSYEPRQYNPNENGFFTNAIIRAFSQPDADTDKDKMISSEELKNYVIRTVSERSRGLQNPTIDRDNIYQKLYFPLVEDAE